jgi:uncharacterized protein YbjT (DUF2867 family)
MTETAYHRPTLVLGGTGKTGRRLVERLTRRHIPVRIGSRSAGLPFDWDQPSTWGPVFQDVVAAYTATIAEATGRDIAYTRIPPEAFAAGLAAGGVPPNISDFLVHLFGTVLDGRNAAVGHGIERVLGRPARDFADYARVTAATGVWNPSDQPNPGGPR